MKYAPALASALAVVSLAATSVAQSFQYFDFANVSTLTLNGSAVQSGNMLRLTNNGSAQTGSMWQTAQVSVTEGFETQFEFVLTTAGEGMAFVIHGDPAGAAAIGGNLWGLGYGFGNTTNPIANCLAIEIDAVQQGFLTDLSANELSIHTQGAFGNSENEGASIARITPQVNMKSGTVHTMRVTYLPGTLSVYVDNLNTPLLSTPFTFEAGGTQLSGGSTGGLGLPSNLAWVGFTATTPSGSSNQRAELRSWTWVSQFAPDPCYVGNAGSTVGGPYDLLTISGTAGGFYRNLHLATADPFSLELAPPPGQISAPFVLLMTIGIANELTVTPTPWGSACFPPVFVLDIGSFTAPYSVSIPAGLVLNLPFTFQAVMATDALNPTLIELTNAVALDFTPAAPPQISSLSPKSAIVGGTITVMGSHFSPFATATINGVNVPLTTVAPGQITFAMPASVSCDATLTVRNPDGSTAQTPFNPTPIITSQFNPTGSVSGGTSYIAIGTGFAPGTTVTIGGNPANVTSASATIVVCVVPPGSVGQAPIVITTPGGCTVTSIFTYF